MQKIYCLLIILLSAGAFAATGDTIKVSAHREKAMVWYGAYDTVAVFPPATKKYSRIIMHYTMGCPTTGCSQWDYTTQIFLMKKTGAIDSTKRLVPDFTVNGNAQDTLRYSDVPTHKTVYNANSKQTDTLAADSFFVRMYADTTQPFTQTDSFYVWQGNFMNYLYDTTGAKVDSYFVATNNTLVAYKTTVYDKYNVLEPFELGRVITPYGGYYSKTWKNEFRFDVTDFAPLLHDTVMLRAFYSGWSSGFTVTLDFDLIEGTPARDVMDIRNVYIGDYSYGNANNPLENQLTQKTFSLNGATQAKFRFTPTGHGFGADNTENCAEFCNKQYEVMANNSTVGSRNIWRDDCGLNPLWHQSGTWLFDRANWCPGDKGLTHEFELTPFLSGNNLTLQVVPEAYEDLNPAGVNPIYTIASQVVTYGNNNFSVDATVEDVIAPNNHDAYRRYNPICANPKVILKNNGLQTLNTARFYYGIEGKELFFYDWAGSLAFDRTETVTLPYRVINDSAHRVFRVWVTNPNGTQDAYVWNDTLRVNTELVPRYDSVFNFVLKTNNDYTETTWQLKDDAGNLWYENGTLAASKIYTETFMLNTGCFTFELHDSGKDGLSFFANQQTSGTGYARFTKYPSNNIFKTFEPDFGTLTRQSFIIGMPEIFVPSALTEVNSITHFNTYPNPTRDMITVELSLYKAKAVSVELIDVMGATVQQIFNGEGERLILPVDVTGLAAGVYMVKVSGKGYAEMRRVIIH